MWWNTVNSVPGQGTPKGWEKMGGGFRQGTAQAGIQPSRDDFGDALDFNYDEVFNGGREHVPLTPSKEPKWGPNWEEDVGVGKHPDDNYYFYIPRLCNHCTHPACKESCPRQAIEKREEDGIVLINGDRCRGYSFCAEACPYKKIYFNEAAGISQKCIFCLPRVENGVANACMRQCPGRVRFVGYLDDPAGPIHKLVYKYKVALPLHPEYETTPNVYYVPPLSPTGFVDGDPSDASRIPLAYLETLFGKQVGNALQTLKNERARRQKGHESELMDLLISRDWKQMLGPFNKHPREAGRETKTGENKE
jgi:ethylbenzene hydroxylase subunit beta/complex iron-sulfur molybdoenzyme family reductase subunit beta